MPPLWPPAQPAHLAAARLARRREFLLCRCPTSAPGCGPAGPSTGIPALPLSLPLHRPMLLGLLSRAWPGLVGMGLSCCPFGILLIHLCLRLGPHICKLGHETSEGLQRLPLLIAGRTRRSIRHRHAADRAGGFLLFEPGPDAACMPARWTGHTGRGQTGRLVMVEGVQVAGKPNTAHRAKLCSSGLHEPRQPTDLGRKGACSLGASVPGCSGACGTWGSPPPPHPCQLSLPTRQRSDHGRCSRLVGGGGLWAPEPHGIGR